MKHKSNDTKKHLNITYLNENKTVESFNYSTKTLLTFVETVMLFFKANPLYKEYTDSFQKGFNLALNKELKAYKVVFCNNTKLQIDNKQTDLIFLELNDLINNYFIKNNDYIKKYAKVNFKAKVFLQVIKHYDITYYNVYTLSKKTFKDLQTCFNLTSHKRKFNLNSKERKLVFKHKNGYFKNKYSYNLLYFEELQDNIKSLENKAKDIKLELQYFEDLFLLNKNKFFELQQEYIDLQQELKTVENTLYNLKVTESNLLSSKPKNTTIEDFYKSVNLEYKRKQV